MGAGRAMTGPRLPYVVRKLEGKLKVTKWKMEKVGKGHKMTSFDATEDAGYIAFFPQGHWLRIRTKEDLERYGLSRKPRPIGDDGPLDPRFAPEDAFENLEAKVVAHVKQVCGGSINIPGFDGKINLPKVTEDSYVTG